MGEAIGGGGATRDNPQASFGSSRPNTLALHTVEVYSQEILANYLSYLQPSAYEGQEDQLGALGLVVNTIVLWNTRSGTRTSSVFPYWCMSTSTCTGAITSA